MAEENREELTFRFADDGEEYKVSDLSEENTVLYNRFMVLQQRKNDLINNTQFEVDNLQILINEYGARLQAAVESSNDEGESE